MIKKPVIGISGCLGGFLLFVLMVVTKEMTF